MFLNLNTAHFYLLAPSMLALCLTANLIHAAAATTDTQGQTLSLKKTINPVIVENTKPGTKVWQHIDLTGAATTLGTAEADEIPGKVVAPILSLTSIATSTATVTSKTATTAAAAAATVCDTTSPNFPWAVDDCVVGYTSTPSVNKGSNITFKISVNPAPQTYSIDIYRMGWYGGAGGTFVTNIPARSGVKQPACPMNTSTGLTECNWSNSYTLAVPRTWTSGVYLAQVNSQSGWIGEILFVVRDDHRAADFLYQVPVLTYSAYNNYPVGTPTGKSVYDADSSGANTLVGSPRAVKVSFDRPQHHQFGSWLGTDWTEIHLVAWLEKMGYNLNYSTDVDVHNAPIGSLEKYKGIIIGGHGEYWTKAMYDKTEFARSAGTNLAFFGANAVHWQVRLENSSKGVANRVLTCYKDELTGTQFDPITDPLLKTMHWRALGRAEQTLIGVQHDINGWNNNTINQPPLVVKNSSHWVYDGTSLTEGSTVPYLIGYEIDNLNPAYPAPPLLTPTSQTIIGESPYVNHSGAAYTSQASIYQAPSGAWVFGSGTMSWSWALAREPNSWVIPNEVYQDANIQKVTQNILDAFKNSAYEALETGAVTVFKDANYAGLSQSYGFGKYYSTQNELTVVGNNAISSIKIKPGYTVTLCNNVPPSTGVCKILTSDTANLTTLSFDNLTSYIEVKPPVNLALGKPASQSSTYLATAIAGRAVDGDTDGNYSGNSIAHTNAELNPWWQVDLGAQNDIHNIILGNRLDCCTDRLSNFYVFVSNTDLTGRSFTDIVNDASVWRQQMQGQVGSSLSIPATVNGRYVRVQLAGQNYLSLREVLVR
ncbi:MAG: N,N-dimethylformamidase beta subunit family domain-containing protein [Methylococcales bacterium]